MLSINEKLNPGWSTSEIFPWGTHRSFIRGDSAGVPAYPLYTLLFLTENEWQNAPLSHT